MNNMNNNLNNDNQVTMFEMVMGFLTVFNTILNTKQTSNDVIFKELQHQNKDYLEKILQNIIFGIDTLAKQNKEIKEKLNKLEEKIEFMKNINL